MSLMQDIEELRERLEVLTALAEQCKPLPFPQEGETFWFYSVGGHISNDVAKSTPRVNVFRTEEEAITARNIALAKQRVVQAIAIANDGWRPDWDNKQKPKFFISLAHNKDLSVERNFVCKYCANALYMKSGIVARQILEEHREDLYLILRE